MALNAYSKPKKGSPYWIPEGANPNIRIQYSPSNTKHLPDILRELLRITIDYQKFTDFRHRLVPRNENQDLVTTSRDFQILTGYLENNYKVEIISRITHLDQDYNVGIPAGVPEYYLLIVVTHKKKKEVAYSLTYNILWALAYRVFQNPKDSFDSPSITHHRLGLRILFELLYPKLIEETRKIENITRRR